jgi:hypothetical protein
MNKVEIFVSAYSSGNKETFSTQMVAAREVSLIGNGTLMLISITGQTRSDMIAVEENSY